MMQVADIKTALKDDTIFNAINKEFLSLDLDDVKNNNQDLQKFMSDCPGYIKIKRTDDLPNVSKASNNKEMKSFIDDDSYLNQEKIRTWMESILSKVARTTSGNDQYIKLDRYPQITKKKSGPAFTLNVRFSNGDFVDIDLVPVLVYPIHNPPPKCSGKFSHSYINLQGSNNKSQDNNKCWSAVPKPLNNNKGKFPDARHRYWRLCFYDYEKDILSKYGRAKPVIRHLKKLRDTEDCMKNIASYYIETLCLHELQIFEGSNKVSSTFLFFTMLEKFHEAFQKRCIKHYWEDFNLLENMGLDEMIIIENRLNKIIKEIKKSIKDDKFAIARFVLKKDELEKLKRVINDHATAESNPKEIQTESSNESRCIII
ncbi:cyclic GMP-AMP synthase-like receptor isoform X2 [Linepithema humile]|uniref:cyclic GMP-AMP synthase-like receptor isoform X2 n=1 Tax=Linepithema humile TaxID=83485 RepID=UPI0006237297|nr:PREDICTED: uncharacterized protein LOC105675429 isoform X2 [Linepithema humile]